MSPYRQEFLRHHEYLRGALVQVPAADWFAVPGHGANSIAIILNHLAGNLTSRFSDFLTTDGEKPWRDRDGEFAARGADDDAGLLVERYNAAIAVLFATLDGLTDADRQRTVTIRGQPLSVEEALCRALAHMAFHVGEIVCLARGIVGPAWQSLSIPPGGSAAYARDPRRERVATPASAAQPLAVPRPGPASRAYALVIHHVADYPAWKRAFDQAAGLRRAAGELTFQVHCHADDPRRIVHHAAWTSLAAARAFFASPEVAAIRMAAGVAQPEFHYLQQLDGGAP